MKNTKERKWWRFYKASKYLESSYEEDKSAILSEYNKLGYRNARIVEDSLYRTQDGFVGLKIKVDEGDQFYFGDITFAGNIKYRTTFLDSLLGINKGDLYNLDHLETRVFMDPKGLDLSSLYQDDGYLTFRAMPIEQNVQNDTIDIEIRMMEGLLIDTLYLLHFYEFIVGQGSQSCFVGRMRIQIRKQRLIR